MKRTFTPTAATVCAASSIGGEMSERMRRDVGMILAGANASAAFINAIMLTPNNAITAIANAICAAICFHYAPAATPMEKQKP